MREFQRRKSVKRGIVEQEYIYARSRLYERLGDGNRAYIDALCVLVGGEYAAALRDFVTTDKGAVRICMEHPVSKSQLYRLVSKYYTQFDINACKK